MQILVSPHVILAMTDCKIALPFGVNNQINTQKLTNTVTQKTARNDCFLDLWRNFCCAISAPGQPPTRDKKCNVLSGVLQSPFWAADLSAAYTKKVKDLEKELDTLDERYAFGTFDDDNLYRKYRSKKQSEINQVRERLQGTEFEISNLDLVKDLAEVVEVLIDSRY